MKQIAKNSKASFQYELLEEFEAGIVLLGSELKSIRAGKVSVNESFVVVDGGELYALYIHISKYSNANRFNHDETRPRKLLLHKKQINKILGRIKTKGLTVVVRSMYFNKRNMVKLSIALAKGKKLHDKRQSIKERDWSREKNRELKSMQ
ncbi:MAG: SsrA-binding protein SmpB [Rickettsiales bacterium]